MTTGLRRRALLASTAAALATPAIAQDMRAKTLRFVPSANLSFLDPTITTAGVSASHGFAVFDNLYGVDGKNRPQRQMVEGESVSDNGRVWTFKLRDGLKFHDNEPVRAADCIASIKRWSARDSFGQSLAAFTDRMEAVDDRTFRIHLKRPMGPILDALGKATVTALYILPERLASTDPFKPITEMIGSGPYKFIASEFSSGSRVAYERNAAYVPRNEPADWTSGGKQAHFERLEWSIIPDPATAAAAIQRGEIDWYEYALLDLTPQLAKHPDISVRNVTPYGLGSVMRFNFLHPPFNNVAIRRIVRDAVNQDDYMRAIHGDDKAWAECHAMFLCGLPGVTEFGAAAAKAPKNYDQIRAALKAAGYNGEKIVIINPTDYTFISSQGQLTADLLKKIGFNVDLIDTDFGTMLRRRNAKDAPDKGGWSLFHTSAAALSVANPAVNYYTRGPADGGWAGWYSNQAAEQANEDWLAAADPAARQAAFEAAQRLAWEDVPYVPLGFWRPKSAFRKSLTGVVECDLALFWNVRRT